MSPNETHSAQLVAALSTLSTRPALAGADTPRSAIRAQEIACGENLLPAFEALRRRPFSWLLDSALAEASGTAALGDSGERHEKGRYSFAGADPYLVLRAFGRRIEIECHRAVRPELPEGFHALEGDVFEWVRRLLPAPPSAAAELPFELPFVGGAVGYFGYELAEFVDAVELHGRDDIGFPDLTLFFVDRLLALDHRAERAWAIGLGFAGSEAKADERAARAAAACSEWAAPGTSAAEAVTRSTQISSSTSTSTPSPTPASPPRDAAARRRSLLATEAPSGLACAIDAAQYRAHVATLLDEIAAGNVYEANLTQRMSLPFSGDAWLLYLSLREQNPAPYAAYLETGDGAILSSSPERFLRLGADGRAESRPIKGTRPRGATPAEDEELREQLLRSAKDRAENLMIVDLVRNDLGRVCEVGSVRVPELMAVESYASVFQLVSTVTGKLRPEHDCVDLIRAAFPPGSMTGAPKIAAIRLLDRLEPVRRGVYSGAIGYLDVRGGLDLAVVIRTLLVKKGHAHLHVGGAVVSDSQPDSEYRESLDKARALFAALARVQPGGD